MRRLLSRFHRGPLRSERGASAVEAALVMPLVIVVCLGIMEVGMYFWDATYTQSAAAAGARTGATQSRVSGYQDQVTAAVTSAMKNQRGTPLTLVVFKADKTTGLPTGATGSDYSTCTSNCWKYTWSAGTWNLVNGTSWPNTSQAACGTSTANDYLGVQLRIRHSSITGIVFNNSVVSAATVMRLEPVPTGGGQVCQ